MPNKVSKKEAVESKRQEDDKSTIIKTTSLQDKKNSRICHPELISGSRNLSKRLNKLLPCYSEAEKDKNIKIINPSHMFRMTDPCAVNDNKFTLTKTENIDKITNMEVII